MWVPSLGGGGANTHRTVRPDGSESIEIDVGGNDTDHLGGWSPDGKRLVLTSEGRVYTVAREVVASG